MKYIFIFYLFGVINIIIVFHKFSQTQNIAYFRMEVVRLKISIAN
jgi:hypothetical protein